MTLGWGASVGIAATTRSLHMKETSSATTCGNSVWLSFVMCGEGALEVVAGVSSLPQDNTLFLIVGRNHSSLKPPPSLPVICFQLSAHQDALHRISLSIRVLLFLLLVVAGDVERNPGPPKPDPGSRG